MTPLTDSKIKNTKPKEKTYTLSDGQGLQLLIKTNGSKLWEFFYKSPATLKRRKTSFGLYPTISDDTITLSKNRLINHFFEYLPKKEHTHINDIDYMKTIKILEKLESKNKLETDNKPYRILTHIAHEKIENSMREES